MLGPRASTPWKLSPRGMPLSLENEKRDSRGPCTPYRTSSKRGQGRTHTRGTWIGGRSHPPRSSYHIHIPVLPVLWRCLSQ